MAWPYRHPNKINAQNESVWPEDAVSVVLVHKRIEPQCRSKRVLGLLLDRAEEGQSGVDPVRISPSELCGLHVAPWTDGDVGVEVVALVEEDCVDRRREVGGDAGEFVCLLNPVRIEESRGYNRSEHSVVTLECACQRPSRSLNGADLSLGSLTRGCHVWCHAAPDSRRDAAGDDRETVESRKRHNYWFCVVSVTASSVASASPEGVGSMAGTAMPVSSSSSITTRATSAMASLDFSVSTRTPCVLRL